MLWIKDSTKRHRTIALAGMVQALFLSYEQGHNQRQNKNSQNAIFSTVCSLFVTSPQSTEEVFGGLYGIRYGLEVLKELWEQPTDVYQQIVEQLRNTIYCSEFIQKNKETRLLLRQQLEVISKKEFTILRHDQAIKNNLIYTDISNVYLKIMDTLPYNIPLKGDSNRLKMPLVTYKLRALFLAGVRATILWQQHGGTFFNTWYHRKLIPQEANQLINEIKSSEIKNSAKKNK